VAATGLITEELKRIRKSVPGVRGSIAASSDGLLIAHEDEEALPVRRRRR
jgi:predicted regulator of Ras-like GTPase activity (Roadblock/LC7/MglB family)